MGEGAARPAHCSHSARPASSGSGGREPGRELERRASRSESASVLQAARGKPCGGKERRGQRTAPQALAQRKTCELGERKHIRLAGGPRQALWEEGAARPAHCSHRRSRGVRPASSGPEGRGPETELKRLASQAVLVFKSTFFFHQRSPAGFSLLEARSSRLLRGKPRGRRRPRRPASQARRRRCAPAGALILHRTRTCLSKALSNVAPQQVERPDAKSSSSLANGALAPGVACAMRRGKCGGVGEG